MPCNATPKDIESIIVKIRQQLALGNWVCVPWDKKFHKRRDQKCHGIMTIKILTQNLDVPIVPVYMDRITETVYRYQRWKD